MSIQYRSIFVTAATFFVVILIFVLISVLDMPDHDKRYMALYIPYSDDLQPTEMFQEELRFSGDKAFYSCGEMGGNRLLDIHGDLVMSFGEHVNFVVSHVDRSKLMADCFRDSTNNSSVLAAYRGETVQLRRLPSPNGSVCFYHYEADIIKCMSRY